jgi:hypothetical protein
MQLRTAHEEQILKVAPDVADLGLRLRFLCDAAGVTFAEIERERGLAQRSVGSYASGRLYAYPKLKRLVSAHLAEALGETPDDVAAYLFPEPSLSAAASSGASGRSLMR